MPPRLIEMRRGDENCGWENAWFLETRNPGDTELPPVTSGPGHFVLDPDGVIQSAALRTTYSSDAELPSDAEFTGYISEGSQLWVSESTIDSAIFLVRGSAVERLPATEFRLLCD